MADAMKCSYEKAAVPHQNLCTLSEVLGKPKGHRTIGLLPFMWSLSNKIRGYVKTWESEHTQSYDAAKKR